jgi:hypothetical protein
VIFAILGNPLLFPEVDSRGRAQVLEALMNNPFRRPNKTAVIVLLSCVLLLAAGVALVTSVDWRPTMMMSANPAPPNGTPGSAQPGTIGLARPHVPLPTK